MIVQHRLPFSQWSQGLPLRSRVIRGRLVVGVYIHVGRKMRWEVLEWGPSRMAVGRGGGGIPYGEGY